VEKVDDMRQRLIKRTLLGLCLFHIFINSLAICVPVIVLFWQAHGLTLTHITILQGFFAALMVVFEVPSGYFADVWGRKRAMVISSIVFTGGTVLLCFSITFLQFMMAEICFAVALSLLSGADAALLYDTLKLGKRSDEYEKIWGRLMSISLAASALLTSMAGFLYQIHMRLPFILGAASIALSLVGALMLTEPPRQRIPAKEMYFMGLWYAVKPYVRENRAYKELILWFAIVFSLVQSALWYYQPYFVVCKIPVIWFGFLFTAFNLTAAVASHFSGHLSRWTQRFPVGAFPLVLVMVSYLIMGHWATPGAAGIILLQQLVRGWFSITISARLNRLVDSANRATLLSFCTMAGKLVYSGFVPLSGWMADRFTLLPALKYLGIAATIMFVIRIMVPRQDKPMSSDEAKYSRLV
jgi:MFS family permease